VLEDVQQAPLRVWANGQAMLVNCQIASTEEPFIADDLMGTGDRMGRKAEKERSRRAAAEENKRLAQMKKGDPPPADLPAWAL
jgi:hypothetical protein